MRVYGLCKGRRWSEFMSRHSVGRLLCKIFVERKSIKEWL